MKDYHLIDQKTDLEIPAADGLVQSLPSILIRVINQVRALPQ